ncbi:hypothetical protein, partial [[Pseudomonas] boreopolis]|uniref:hypothetical protein n=1 Tax=Xanthomonas boreopolis TaxID=86183 RepID=UPI003D9BD7C9
HGRDQRFDALPQRGGNLFATCHAGDFVITAQVYKAVLLAALNAPDPGPSERGQDTSQIFQHVC